jgi:benzoylformate decarboxylase
VATVKKPSSNQPGLADLAWVDQPGNLGNQRMEWKSDAIAEMVRRLDLGYMALVPGASYRGFHDSIVNFLGNTNPKMLVCLHEEHAVAIAHGFAKVTDRPMAVALHTNVGLMHASMAIFNAWCDRKPMVIFGANGPMDAEQRRPWIEWIHTSADQGALVRGYTKWDDAPRSVPAALESILRAYQLAVTPPLGPTYVCLDTGMQEERLEGEVRFPEAERFRPARAAAPRADDVRAAADILLAAERPVILAGRVSRDANAWERRVRLAEALGALVMTDLHTSAAFPSEHPLHPLEPRFHPGARHIEALRRADAILSLDWLDLGGFVKRAGGPEKVPGRIIHASVDSYVHRGWSMDYHILPCADLPILATPDMVVEALLEEIGARGGGTPHAPKLAIEPEPVDKAPPASGPMTLRNMAVLWRAFRDSRNDVSLISMPLGWPGDCVGISGPLDFFGSNGGAGVGAGPGIGVGAALALKDTGRLPVAIVGDGDFAMGATALWTASHLDLPLLYVIANNRAYFNDVAHQERVAKNRSRPPENKWIGQYMTEPEVDMVSLARSFGFEARSVADAAEVPAALEAAAEQVNRGGRFVLDVRVEPGYAD